MSDRDSSPSQTTHIPGNDDRSAAEHAHSHDHEHVHAHAHKEDNPAPHGHDSHFSLPDTTILTIRSHSGLSGDMLLAGLASLNLELMGLLPDSPEASAWLDAQLRKIMPQLAGCAAIERKQVNNIAGWHLRVELPHAHEHRNLEDIKKIIAASAISAEAAARAVFCFELLAASEGAVHNLPAEAVHFHEVGALDSILDICAVCELYTTLSPAKFICSPLPLADGSIICAHGVLPAPAPAVIRLLKGIPVKAFAGDANAGELVTPTAIALLRALNASFGPWPSFCPDVITTVYGSKVFADAPNGAIFAFGKSMPGSN